MKKQINIHDVIKQRLSLQTVQRQLSSFGAVPNYNAILSKSFIKEALKWDAQKLNKFIIILGGPINKNKTFNLLNELIK